MCFEHSVFPFSTKLNAPPHRDAHASALVSSAAALPVKKSTRLRPDPLDLVTSPNHLMRGFFIRTWNLLVSTGLLSVPRVRRKNINAISPVVIRPSLSPSDAFLPQFA